MAFHVDAMVRCLKRGGVSRKLTYECIDAKNLNLQNHCEDGERLILKLNSNCVSSNCIKNSFREKKCSNGEVPYRDGCYPLNDFGACLENNEVVFPKSRLQADEFGNVKCTCLSDFGFLNYQGQCNSEYSFLPCGLGSNKQLLRTEDGNGNCVKNQCDKGKLMWPSKDCPKDQESKKKCLDCLSYDSTVETCDTSLELSKEGIVTCSSIFAQNSVFDLCPDRDSDGKCSASPSPPSQSPSQSLITKSLCSASPDVLKKMGVSCPTS